MGVSAIGFSESNYSNYEIHQQEEKKSPSVFLEEEEIKARRRQWAEVADKNIAKAQEEGVAEKYKLTQSIICGEKSGTVVITLDGKTELATVRNDLKLKGGVLYNCNKDKLDQMNKKQDEFGRTDMDSFVPPAGTTLVVNGSDLFADNPNAVVKFLRDLIY